MEGGHRGGVEGEDVEVVLGLMGEFDLWMEKKRKEESGTNLDETESGDLFLDDAIGQRGISDGYSFEVEVEARVFVDVVCDIRDVWEEEKDNGKTCKMSATRMKWTHRIQHTIPKKMNISTASKKKEERNEEETYTFARKKEIQPLQLGENLEELLEESDELRSELVVVGDGRFALGETRL